MAMTDALYKLQELDLMEDQIKKKQAQLDDDPEYMQEMQKLEDLIVLREEAKKKLAEAIKDQHRKELDLKQTVSRRADIRRRMYDGTVNNMKELEKMTHMVEELDVARDQLEDSILNLMELVENQEKTIMDAEKDLQTQKDRIDELDSSRQEEKMKLDAELNGLPQAREQLLAEIPADQVSRYQNVRSRMGSRPLAKVQGQVCTGCRVSISATVLREMKKGDRLVQCESCGRILHWEKE